jgi:hypothetical protein
LRFFDVAHDCTEKIIVRRHVGRTKRGLDLGPKGLRAKAS